MKREIKFRGQDKNNDWHFGYYYFLNNKHLICENDGFSFKIKPETVGEFSELPDDNGKDVFEHDIVDVCIFFVSPSNCDDDQHFRGVIKCENGNTYFEIYKYLYKGEWRRLSAENTNPSFYIDSDYINEETNTMTVNFFDFCAMSGNRGEYLRENVKIQGNIFQNSDLLK